MTVMFLMSVHGEPYKLFNSKAAVDKVKEWFYRMSRYDASEYNDFDEFQNTGFHFYSIDDVDNSVSVTELEVFD